LSRRNERPLEGLEMSRTATPGTIRVGTSGWIYRGWRGPFYPQKLPQARWFAHYAETFETVEINASFYRLPTQAAVARWRELAPPGFVFAWKASRFITHMKRLRDVEDSLARVFAPMAALGAARGPTLFQLPPQMALDRDRLAQFLAQLPAGRHTVEFRHPSWYADEVFALLAAHQVALCISDHHHAPAPWVATADFVYVRGHGPSGRYAGSYADGALDRWAERIGGWSAEGRDVYGYFDNDIGCAAPRDALRLKGKLGLVAPAAAA
jgi:uncharacterized protein YecE (DUF72 family)